MRMLVAAVLAGGCSWGAVIHGVVLERTTQRPLARTIVRLMAPTGGAPRPVSQTMTTASGTFVFTSVADGGYLVTATRTGFLDGWFGQTRALGPGALIRVSGDQSLFAELRLYRLGGVTGRVLDENGVGIPEAGVVAYRARLPLQVEATGKADDRGVYRIGKLRPGRYWIRSTEAELEDHTGLLPTFYPFGVASGEARAVAVAADQDTTDIDIQPVAGRLFSLNVQVTGCPMGETAEVTLASDVGAKDARVPCEGAFTFPQLAPNEYEIYGEFSNGRLLLGGFQERDYLDHPAARQLSLVGFPSLTLRVMGGEAQVSLRRKDLGGQGRTRKLGEPLPPGYWEVFANPSPGLYFAELWPPRRVLRRDRNMPSDLAPELMLRGGERMTAEVRLSSGAAVVEGTVKERGEAAAAVPVYLYPTSEEVRRRVHGFRSVLSGPNGEYRFDGLPPGEYLVLATREFDDVDEDAMKAARAPTAAVEQGARRTLDLTVWVP